MERNKKIYDYVGKNYEFKKMFSKGDNAGEVNLDKGTISLQCADDIVIPTKNGVEYTVKVVKPEKVNHTINKGDKVGTLCIYANGEKIYSNHLEAANTFKVRKFPKLFFHGR